MANKAHDLAVQLLALADVTVNGSRDWDLIVHDERLFARVLRDKNLGMGEAYMEGWWDCSQIDEMIRRILTARLDERLFRVGFRDWLPLIFNLQSKKRALEVGVEHYDIGNELFRLMLDKNLNYSCAYFKDATDLDAAQIAKMDLICRKLELGPGMRLLDIGCGFGSLAKYAAEHYGVSVVGITISKEQLALGQQRCAGLPVELRFQDWRDVRETFDRVVSVGMFEHVGSRNYSAYMKLVSENLVEDGLFLLHTIGARVSETRSDAWIEKYIFPNSMLPSVAQIGSAIEPYFVVLDWHNFGLDYAKTLRAWHANFTRSFSQLKDRYDERFYRMWTYYLLSSAGGFLAQSNLLWQVVLAKPERQIRYESKR